MLWSGSSPLAVVRSGMWGFLLFAGVAWLAIAWSVLRLQPSDIVHVAGPVVLFGALTEAVRSLAGTRTWWLNAGMAALFAVTGGVLLADQDSSFTTPAALLGWYLMVRGAADIAMSMMTRETDRIWGLLMVVGVLETGLGFFAASPLSRTADLVVTVLGGLALARGVADLVASLRLREVVAATKDVLELPPERAAGVAGYSAGLTDYEAAPVRTTAKHRAPAKSSSPATASAPATASSPATVSVSDPGDWTIAPGKIGSVGSPGQAVAGGMAGAAGYTSSPGATSFHDEVVRTTADLDAMLALAGVTGAAVGAGLVVHHEIPEVPDTPEGAELTETRAGGEH
jgi:uncharacterized membrane protein HdeD (DUF308 family)